MTQRSKHNIDSLIARCIEGDDSAWHDLIDLIAPMVFAVCKKSQLSRDESFDIFGQVSLQLINTIPTLKSPEKIMSFVATITRRRIYKFYHQVILEGVRDEDALYTLPTDSHENPETIYELSEKREMLLRALNKLTPRERRIITHLFFDEKELSYEEIAQKMNIPVSSIGPTRAKALIKLRRIMAYKRFKL